MKKSFILLSALFLVYCMASCDFQEIEVIEDLEAIEIAENPPFPEMFDETDPNARVKMDNSGVFDFETGQPIPQAFSKLRRHDNGIAATIHTSLLEAKAVYTVWVVIFENPELCSDNMCGEDDIFNSEGLIVNGDGSFGTPGVNVTVMWGTGKIASAAGIGTFNLWAEVNNSPGEVLFGPGLMDAMGSEIHFVIRNHGQAIPGLLQEQLTSFEGGCEVNGCTDEQFSIHKP
ncbi:hypothetical protein [Aquiflexum sp.]|uniref:hypothetical protein n=1 Tax=Aquiflexum sp. TaxID=1872584 RepID=UPI00359488DC